MAKVNPIQIQRYLKGLDYPVSKEQLVRHAEQSGADDQVLAALRQLPGNKFNSPNEVSEAFGKVA
jgi:hypothetical protein